MKGIDYCILYGTILVRMKTEVRYRTMLIPSVSSKATNRQQKPRNQTFGPTLWVCLLQCLITLSDQNALRKRDSEAGTVYIEYLGDCHRVK